jgi:PTH1 family peptidyl-tRNA hydrolase
MILIAGLGNPGKDYIFTRHNIGFLIADKFVNSFDQVQKSRKFKSKTTYINIKDKKVIVLKPLTFMNDSGSSLLLALKYFKQDISQILVIHDDIDLDFGVLKFKKDGGTAGHKGLESIVRHLKRNDFDRLRFGVGRPAGQKNAADYVLKKFNCRELKELDLFCEKAAKSLSDYVEYGIDYSMNKYNRLPRD